MLRLFAVIRLASTRGLRRGSTCGSTGGPTTDGVRRRMMSLMTGRTRSSPESARVSASSSAARAAPPSEWCGAAPNDARADRLNVGAPLRALVPTQACPKGRCSLRVNCNSDGVTKQIRRRSAPDHYRSTARSASAWFTQQPVANRSEAAERSASATCRPYSPKTARCSSAAVPLQCRPVSSGLERFQAEFESSRKSPQNRSLRGKVVLSRTTGDPRSRT